MIQAAKGWVADHGGILLAAAFYVAAFLTWKAGWWTWRDLLWGFVHILYPWG